MSEAETEALSELRDWLLNGAPCVTGGCYAAGVVRQADIFKLFAHISRIEKERDEAREALRPFAREATAWVTEAAGTRLVVCDPEDAGACSPFDLSVDDFRNAALASARGEVPPQAESEQVSSRSET